MNSLKELHKEAVAMVLDYGEMLESGRIGASKELIGFSLSALADRSCLIDLPSFKWSYAELFASTILSGKSMHDKIPKDHPAQKYIGENHGGHLSTQYGPRLAPQIAPLIEELVECANSRRATLVVLQAGDNWLFNNNSTEQEYPCAVAYSCYARNGKLILVLHMRSNNVFRTLPYDLFIASMLLEQLAIGINSYERGSDMPETSWKLLLTVNFGSAHIFEHDLELAKSYLYAD